MSDTMPTPRRRPGTVFCILCNGIVSYKKGDTKRFEDHMNIEHGAFYNLEYILAGCLMNGDQRKVMSKLIEENPAFGSLDSDEGNDEENLKDVSILDKAFPLVVNTSINSNPVVSLTKLKSESLGEVDSSKVNCGVCDSRISKSNLSRHLIKVHKLGKEERELVLKSMNNTRIEFKSKELVKKECVKEVHNDESIADEINEAAEVEVKEDSNIHTNDQKLKCPMCDSLFTKSQNLKRHVLKKHPEDENVKSSEYNCKEQKSLKSHASSKHKGEILTTHPLATSTVKDINLKCELCKYSCTKASSLKIHKTMKHKAKENFEQKLLISESLFKRRTSQPDEEVMGKE